MYSAATLGALLIAGGIFVAITKPTFFNRPGGNTAAAVLIDPLSDAVVDDSASLGSDYRVYNNTKFNFSIEYPEELLLEAYDEGEDAQTIVFKNGKQGLEYEGFQIFIQPFTEPVSKLTLARVREDLPHANMENVQEAVLDGNTRALLFWSDDPQIGTTREVWFVHGGYLYEITTLEHLDLWLAKLMSTWKFINTTF